LEQLHLQLRAARSPELPDQQRGVLAGSLPYRRTAGGRGGLDVVPGLLAEKRGMDTQSLRRAGEHRGGGVSAPLQRRGLR
jgi:hypothetical protein